MPARRPAGRRRGPVPRVWQLGYASWRAEPARRAAGWPTPRRDGPFVSRFRELARELGLAIVVSYLQRWPGAPRNTATLIDRHGHAALTYAKVHTCDFGEEAALTPGDRLPPPTRHRRRQRAGRADDLLRPRVPRVGPRAHAGRRRAPADAERVPADRPRRAVPRPRLREHGRRGDGQLRPPDPPTTTALDPTTRATVTRSPSAASASTARSPLDQKLVEAGADSSSRSRASTSTPCARTARRGGRRRVPQAGVL